MRRLRALRLRRLRKAAVISAAAMLLPAGSSCYVATPSGGPPSGRSAFAIFATALAGDAGNAARSAAVEDAKKGHHHGGKNKTQTDAQADTPPPTNVSVDPSRRMLQLHLKLGAMEHRELSPREHRNGPGANGSDPRSTLLNASSETNRHPLLRHERQHENVAWNLGLGHAAEREGKTLNEVSLRSIMQHGLKEASPAEALDKTVNPVAARYQSSVFEKSSSTTIMAKTSLAIGTLSFSQHEVLAVGMDPESIEKAEGLGFKADPQPLNSESSGHIITRFTVPPGLDAVRAKDLLSNELPGQRFELNKVYRVYRAAVREDPEMRSRSQPIPVSLGSSERCQADRCFARQVIGWNETLARCAKGLKVGIIDTDVEETHPAFAGRSIHRFDFSPDGRTPSPNWHGTAVLSLLAGSPLTGTPGLIPDAEFFAANIFFSDERGDMAADTLALLKALDWMKRFEVRLINMSFSGPRDELVAEAVERMSESGVVFVAAAGNGGPSAEPSYPAAYPQVIAVTAVTKELRNYRYANRGDHIDVSAPGVDIWTAMPGGRAAYHSGTSFAAPHVTAVLAVHLRETLQHDKASLLGDLPIQDLGHQGRDPVYGRGLLHAPFVCVAPAETIASASD